MITKLTLIGFIFISFGSVGQFRDKKTEVIIKELNLIEVQISSFKYEIEYLKSQVKGKDSIRVFELEKLLSDQEILKRIKTTFKETLSNKEVRHIYKFVKSSAYEKLITSGTLFKNVLAQFQDVEKEIEEITKNLRDPVIASINNFEPVPVERENGFYATVNYVNSIKIVDVKLHDKPSLTNEDILKINKEYNSVSGKFEIVIIFTENGAHKFYALTKENINKPIAFVVANHIISMPIVTSEITGGKIIISDNYSEQATEIIIKSLTENN